MEAKESPGDGKAESPSQESIGHRHSMKRDVESLEDFEDITKDVPSMKDTTAQFLLFETGDRMKPQSKEFVFEHDSQLDFEPKEKHQTFIPHKENNFNEKQVSNDYEDLYSLEHSHDSNKKFSNTEDEQLDLTENLLKFDQTDFQNKKFEGVSEPGSESNFETRPISIILDENKLGEVLNNDDISSGSEDLSIIPKKGESSPLLPSDFEEDIPKKPLSEHWSNEATNSTFNSQPLSKFTSEPGVNRKQEPEILQGDGLHVKENNDEVISDNEDLIPEPIPKDYPEITNLEGNQILATLGLDSWFRPDMLNPKIESLIYWRNPKKSGAVFGSILVILLSLTSYSLISVIAYTSLTALTVTFIFRIYKNIQQVVQKTSEGHPFRTYLVPVLNHPIISAVFLTLKEYLDFDLTVNPEKAREIADVIVLHVNKSVTDFRNLILIEDIIESAKFGVCLWWLTYIGAWFNGLSLLIIAFVGLFTLPKVYENNKTQIDASLDIVKGKINEVTEKIKAVIPMGKKSDEVKTKGD